MGFPERGFLRENRANWRRHIRVWNFFHLIEILLFPFVRLAVFFLLLQRDGMLSAEPENPPD
jgi:hypothetical protein